MNISFTQNINAQISNYSKPKTQPKFCGVEKNMKPANIKESGTLLRKLYDFIFVPYGEKATKLTEEFVYTQRREENGAFVISKKYNKWSKKPLAIVTDNKNIGIRTKQTMKTGGIFDAEIRDMHTPGYKISVEYKNLKDMNNHEYNDSLTLTYCDKKIDISNKERLNMLQKFDESIDNRYEEVIKELLDRDSKIDKLQAIQNYYKDPEVIGAAILRSPSSINKQLESVSTSMPYGIEHILKNIENK